MDEKTHQSGKRAHVFRKDFFFLRVALAAVLCIAISSVTILRWTLPPVPSGNASRHFDCGAKDILPRFAAEEKASDKWRFITEKDIEGNVRKFIFEDSDGGIIELHFAPVDTRKPCYARTHCFNAAFRTNRALTPGEERALKRILEDVRRAEERHPVRRESPSRENSLSRLRSLQGVLILLLFLLLFDMGGIVRRGTGESAAHAGAARKKQSRFFFGAICLVSLLLLFVHKIAFFPWRLLDMDDFISFARLTSGDTLSFIIGEQGLPAIPYRALLVLLSPAKSLLLIRWVVIAVGAVVVCLTFLLSRRFIRPSLAWMIPVLLASLPLFDFGLADLRGYLFFTLFGFLSVYLFLIALEKPRPAWMFLWVACHVIAFTTNPLTVALTAGPFLYYLTLARKELPSCARRDMEIHFAVIAAAFLVFLPVVFGAAGFGTRLAGVATNPARYGVAPLFSASRMFWAGGAALFLAAAMKFRKDSRAALFLTAFCGIAASLVLQAMNMLLRMDAYFLFVLPLALAGFGVLAEFMVKAAEARGARAAAIGTAVVFAVFIFAVAGPIVVRHSSGMPRNVETAVRETFPEADTAVEDSVRRGIPVFFYPKQYFVFYMTHREKWNLFDRNPVDNKQLGFRRFRREGLGTDIFRVRSFYSSDRPLEKPATFAGGPFRAIVFRMTKESAEAPTPSAFRDSRCRAERAVSKRISIYFCVPR